MNDRRFACIQALTSRFRCTERPAASSTFSQASKGAYFKRKCVVCCLPQMSFVYMREHASLCVITKIANGLRSLILGTRKCRFVGVFRYKKYASHSEPARTSSYFAVVATWCRVKRLQRRSHLFYPKAPLLDCGIGTLQIQHGDFVHSQSVPSSFKRWNWSILGLTVSTVGPKYFLFWTFQLVRALFKARIDDMFAWQCWWRFPPSNFERFRLLFMYSGRHMVHFYSLMNAVGENIQTGDRPHVSKGCVLSAMLEMPGGYLTWYLKSHIGMMSGICCDAFCLSPTRLSVPYDFHCTLPTARFDSLRSNPSTNSWGLLS